MNKQVVRKIKDGPITYLVIMDESIAKRGSGRNIECNKDYYYSILCNHIRVSEIIFNECSFSEHSIICPSDVFYLPTVDEYIKLGMILRHHRRRFNKKKNEIITLKNVQK